VSRPAEQTQPRYALRSYIAGEWHAPAAQLPEVVCDANTGDWLFQQAASTPEQIETVLRAAADAYQRRLCRGQPPEGRSQQLYDIADALEAITEEIAAVDARTTGVPITLTRVIAGICPAAFRAAAALAAEDHIVSHEQGYDIERLPLGPAAIIAPWNAPSAIACHKIASALAAGCPVVFKPSEWAPLSGQMIAEAIAGVDLPAACFQLLHGAGDTGAAIVADKRIAAVSFTGGLAAGRSIAVACAQQIKPAQLELGGNNPLIVLPDADVDAAVAGIVTALTTLNGQWCRALGRLIVHASLFDEVIAKTMQRLAALRLGDSTAADTDVGPLVHRQHRDHVQAAIEACRRQGATVLQSTPMPALNGWFVPPTLITGVAPEQCLEEIFGPVATAHPFESLDEAIELANQPSYGLAAYVFGDEELAVEVARHLEAGMVKVNAVTLFSPDPSAPRAAWKLSGIGDEGTRETFEFFRGTRVVGVAQGSP
jgi:acyl-CoA reductase-like NAD-dependent aldehyde dehydrogenase